MTTPTDSDLGARLRDRARVDAPPMTLDTDRVLSVGRRRVRRRRWGAGVGVAVMAVAMAGVASLLTWVHPTTGPAASDRAAALDLRLVTASTSGACTAPPLAADGPGTACDLDATTTYQLGASLGEVTPASVELDDSLPGGPTVQLTFEGADLGTLATVSEGAVGQRLAVLVDGRVLFAAQLMAPITNGQVAINGDSPSRAAEMVTVLTGRDDAGARAAAIEGGGREARFGGG